MVSVIFIIGIATAVFVGLNIGGSSTGVAFGPATGSGIIPMRYASGLMSIFVLLGGIIIGTNVVETLGEGFIPPQHFTPTASILVLLFIGIGILFGNILKISVSTSETEVVAVAGMGVALGVLNWETVGKVVMWWIVSPVLAFWISGFIGRYIYKDIVTWLNLESKESNILAKIVIIGIGCYMAFSAGASISLGAFLLGPRTMGTVGEGITDLSLEGAIIVEVISATIITGLSWGGIPASLAITTTSSVIGLGWGQASSNISIYEILQQDNYSNSDWEEE